MSDKVVKGIFPAVFGVLISSVGIAAPRINGESDEKVLLTGLAADEYAVREQAYAELLRRARGYNQDRLMQLARNYFVGNDPEVRTRLHAILQEARQVRPKPILGLSFKDEMLKLKDGTRVIAMHVRRVSHGKSAQKGGLLVGDKIVRMGEANKKPGAQPYVAKEAIASLPVGEKVPFHILRDDKPLVLLIRVEGAPVDNSEEARIEKEEKFAAWLEAQNPRR